MELTIKSTILLDNRVDIPVLGLGLFKVSEGEVTEKAVQTALEIGYRHFDTAAVYKNEASLGKALRESGIPRSELFITSKVWNDDQGYESTLKACDASLKKLGVSYIDLYLVHWPVPGKRLDTWRAMETLHEQGLCKAIGVSNYMRRHLVELLFNCNVKPSVNQLELSPFNYTYREDVVMFCRKNDIMLAAYSPLTKGMKLQDPRLVRLASRYYKTPAQILIRWAVQENLIVIPKSEKKERIFENANIFDFTLSSDDMVYLNSLNENLVTSWDPTDTP